MAAKLTKYRCTGKFSYNGVLMTGQECIVRGECTDYGKTARLKRDKTAHHVEWDKAFMRENKLMIFHKTVITKKSLEHFFQKVTP